LRRQAASRALPAGSSRDERLDPFSLPLRFVPDAGDAAPARLLELHSDRAVLLRTLAGNKMRLTLPLRSYLGVALRMHAPTAAARGYAAVVLEHPDPQLCVTLYHASDADEIAAQWRCWGRALGLRLLVVASDGSLREPFSRVGRIQIGETLARRRSRSPLKFRGGIQRLRRRAGSLVSAAVHRGEREIIARN
jgi:hypothetical protein